MIRYIAFKFIIEKYVSHLKNHARILQKTSAQSAKAGPEPAILRITPQPLKVRSGKPHAQHMVISGCPAMIPATIIVTVQRARGRSLQHPTPSQDPAPMADSVHPGRCCHADRRIWITVLARHLFL